MPEPVTILGCLVVIVLAIASWALKEVLRLTKHCEGQDVYIINLNDRVKSLETHSDRLTRVETRIEDGNRRFEEIMKRFDRLETMIEKRKSDSSGRGLN